MISLFLGEMVVGRGLDVMGTRSCILSPKGRATGEEEIASVLLLSLSQSASGLGLLGFFLIFSPFCAFFSFSLFRQNTEVSSSRTAIFLQAAVAWQHFPTATET